MRVFSCDCLRSCLEWSYLLTHILAVLCDDQFRALVRVSHYINTELQPECVRMQGTTQRGSSESFRYPRRRRSHPENINQVLTDYNTHERTCKFNILNVSSYIDKRSITSIDWPGMNGLCFSPQWCTTSCMPGTGRSRRSSTLRVMGWTFVGAYNLCFRPETF